MSKEISNEIPDIMLKLSVIAGSMALTMGAAKFIDDAFITPYYKSKEYYEKYGMKKYMISPPME